MSIYIQFKKIKIELKSNLKNILHKDSILRKDLQYKSNHSLAVLQQDLCYQKYSAKQ